MPTIPMPTNDNGLATTRIVHRALWEATADRIRDEIMDGTLPAGTKLNELDLAARYGVSRGPVREALRSLGQLGVVAFVPRRGAFVSSPSDADLEEVYLARDAIETAAARVAITRATDDDLLALRSLLREMEMAYEIDEYPTAWAVDLELHRTIVQLAGNSRLMAFFEQLASQTLLAHRDVTERRGGIVPAPPAELHRDLVEALIARDDAAVEAAVDAHFGYAGERPFDVASRR
jgi:DNA-binding GntR family transcriptional regulator